MKNAAKLHLKLVATKAKKAALIMLKTQKALIKAKLLPKSLVKHVVEASIKEVITLKVVTTTKSKCTVRLL